MNKSKEIESEKETQARDKDKEGNPVKSPAISVVIPAEPTFPKLMPKVPPPRFPQRLRKAN